MDRQIWQHQIRTYDPDPCQHDTLSWYWFNVGPPSATLVQHWADTGPVYRVFCLGLCLHSRVVLSEAVDLCIYFTRKIQHGGDWERSRPQGPKNVHNFLMTVRLLSWAWERVAEILLILKNYFRTDYSGTSIRYELPKKYPMIFYEVNLWLKPVSASGASAFSENNMGFV